MSGLDWFTLIGGCLGWLTFAWLLRDSRRQRQGVTVTRIAGNTVELTREQLAPHRSRIVVDGLAFTVERVTWHTGGGPQRMTVDLVERAAP